VHFTSACDNNCAHCIDKKFEGTGVCRPNPDAIAKTILDNKDGLDDVLFLGGEPCLYLDELIECVKKIKANSNLKVFVTTSVPYVCKQKYDTFLALIEMLDGINLSVQHYREDVADQIRRVKSKYDRQEFYAGLPHKDKIRINLNVVKPFLYTKDDLTSCLRHYDCMGFNSIKLSEIQHGTEAYVSFEKTFGIKLPHPYSGGCQTYLDTSQILGGFKTPLLLKRSCFMCEETLKASLADGLKVISHLVSTPKNKYGVVYEDGRLEKGWI
jgi:organic radical activating enzyme